MLGLLLITSCFVPSFASPTCPAPCETCVYSILLSRHLSIRPQATSHWLAVSSSRCAFNHQMRSRAASFPLICPCASLARPPSGKRSSQSLRVYPFNFYCQSLAPHFCGSLKRSAKNTVVTDVDNLLRQLSREPNGRPNLGMNDKGPA